MIGGLNIENSVLISTTLDANQESNTIGSTI